MVISELKTKDIFTRLVVGLIQQEDDKSEDSHTPMSVLHPYIRHAWEYVYLVTYTNNVAVPNTITDFVAWLHQPVTDWVVLGDHFTALGLTGSILDQEGLTPEFRALGEKISNTYKPHLELEDSYFKAIFEQCKMLEDALSYTVIRTFLIENPIYHDIYDITDISWQDAMTSQVVLCYESIPTYCVRGANTDQYIVICPHCGWTLNWRRDNAYCHEDSPCTIVYPQLSLAEDDPQYCVPYHPDLVRTKEGIQRFVIAPEVSLLEIYRTLQKIPFVQCELFPNLDSYDLLVTLPSGERWAVDVKDWANAVSLAIGVSDTLFRYFPNWDRAFYVFPNYRAKPAYLNEFKNYWTPQKGVDFCSQNRFVKLVREASR